MIQRTISSVKLSCAAFCFFCLEFVFPELFFLPDELFLFPVVKVVPPNVNFMVASYRKKKPPIETAPMMKQ